MSGRNRKYDLEPLREAISQRKQARQPVSEILRWLRGEGINIKRTQLYAIMTEWQIVPPRPSSEDIPGFDILLQDLIYRKGLSDYEISIAMSEEFGCTYKPVTIRNLRLQRGLLRRNISQRREELTEQWRAIVEAEFRRGALANYGRNLLYAYFRREYPTMQLGQRNLYELVREIDPDGADRRRRSKGRKELATLWR